MLIDIFLIILIAAGVYGGYLMELLRFIKYPLTVFFTLAATLKISNLLSDKFSAITEIYSLWANWAIVLITLFTLVWLLYKLAIYFSSQYNVEKLLQMKRVLGGFVLAFCFTVLYAYVIYFLHQSSVIDKQYISDSFTGKYLLNLAQVGNKVLSFGLSLFYSVEELARETLDGGMLDQ
jgi:hypothetical protein